MFAPPRSTALRSPKSWAVAGVLLGGLLALLLFAPARWLASALAQASHDQLQLQGARGTVWDGSAQVVLTGGVGSRDAMTLPTRLQWQVRAQWGHLALRLQTACCTPQPLAIQIEPGWSSLTLRVQDSHSQWPAVLLSGLGTPWNTLQPQGNLNITTQALALALTAQQLGLTGSAQLDASEVSSSLSTLKPIGNYRLNIVGGATPSLQLETLPGSRLQLVGTGRWVDARLRFEGTASAEPDYLDALSNLLNIIGRRNGARSIIQVG